MPEVAGHLMRLIRLIRTRERIGTETGGTGETDPAEEDGGHVFEGPTLRQRGKRRE